MRDNSVVNFGENAKKTLFYEKMKIQVGLRHNFHGGGGLVLKFLLIACIRGPPAAHQFCRSAA